MKKLNPITALYLKILEVISFLLIQVGGKFEDSLINKNATPEEHARARQIARRYRRHRKCMGGW